MKAIHPNSKTQEAATPDVSHCITVCNRLLRGERSAIESYDQAIEKYGDQAVLADIQLIREEHAHSALLLEENIRAMRGVPEQTSGAWGVIANLVQGAANLFGTGSALEALQNGERSGRDDYLSVLDDPYVIDATKQLIRDQLLPRVEAHIEELGDIQEAA